MLQAPGPEDRATAPRPSTHHPIRQRHPVGRRADIVCQQGGGDPGMVQRTDQPNVRKGIACRRSDRHSLADQAMRGEISAAGA